MNILEPIDVTKLNPQESRLQPEPVAVNVPSLINQARSTAQATQQSIQPLLQQQSAADMDIQNIYGELAGESGFRNDLIQQTGLRQSQKSLRDLSTQMSVNDTRLEQDINDLLAGDRERGATQRSFSIGEQVMRREGAVKQMGLAAKAQALQGNIETAASIVDDELRAKYDPMRAILNAKQANLARLDGKVSGKEKTLQEQKKLELDLQLQQINSEESLQKEARTLALQLGQNGAPADVVSRAFAATTPQQVAEIGGGFLRDPNADLAREQFEYGKSQDSFNNVLNARNAGLVYDPATGEFFIPESTGGLSPTAQGLYDGSIEISKVPGDQIDRVLGELQAAGLEVGGLGKVAARETTLKKLEEDLADLERVATPRNIKNSSGKIQTTWGLGTKEQKEDFLAQMDYIIKNLTFENLQDLKAGGATFGALSDSELRAIAQSSGTLATRAEYDGETLTGFRGEEGALMLEVEKIKTKMREAKERLRLEEFNELQSEFGIAPTENFNTAGEPDPNARTRSIKPEQPISFTPQQVSQTPAMGGRRLSQQEGVKAVMEAVGIKESSSRYDAIGPLVKSGMYKGEKALGKYQVMPGNLPQWSKQALGRVVSPQEFLRSPALQDKIAEDQFSRNIKKFGNIEDAVSVWFSGRPVAQAGNASDGMTTVPEYINAYRQNIRKVIS